MFGSHFPSYQIPSQSSRYPSSRPTPLRPSGRSSISVPPPPLSSRKQTSTRYSRNGFEVHVVGATNHGSDGYVRIDHGKSYTILMTNSNLVPCDAKVTVDGKYMGTYRIGANSSINLEGPPEEIGRFAFFETGTEEALDSDISIDDRLNGEIRVTFTPHKPLRRYRSSRNGFMNQSSQTSFGSMGGGSMGSSTSASRPTESYLDGMAEGEGATGLSGFTDQTFRMVDSVPLNNAAAQTIGFRLISTGLHTCTWAGRPLDDLNVPEPW